MNTPASHRLRAVLSLLAGAVMISFAAVFVRTADLAATTSAFYRMLFGSATLMLLLISQPSMRAGFGRHWPASVLIGALFAADLWFWHRSILLIGPGLATLLANFQVFVLALAGVLWMRERTGWRFAVGLALAMIGLWLLFGRDWTGLNATVRAGILYGLLTACAYGGYLLCLRGFQIRHQRLSPEARLLQVSLVTALLLALLNGFEGHDFAIPDARSLLSLIALGVICQVLGWLAITRGMPGLPASLVGLLLLLQPTLSVLWDVLFFGLRLGPVQWIGAALALAGIYFGLRASQRAVKQPG
ncbi:MAG: DMT family transporter [Wenzhouxiangellaceae bacterium]